MATSRRVVTPPTGGRDPSRGGARTGSLFDSAPRAPSTGSGSYGESEQQDDDTDFDDEDAVNVHESEHDGDLSFESELSNEELVERLSRMKGDDED